MGLITPGPPDHERIAKDLMADRSNRECDKSSPTAAPKAVSRPRGRVTTTGAFEGLPCRGREYQSVAQQKADPKTVLEPSGRLTMG